MLCPWFIYIEYISFTSFDGITLQTLFLDELLELFKAVHLLLHHGVLRQNEGLKV